MRKIIMLASWLVLLGLSGLTAPAQTGPPFPDPPANPALTLEKALQLAETLNPDLASTDFATRRDQALVKQAGYRPNPRFSLSMENLGNHPTPGGPMNAEYTVEVGQTFELGGKRGRRVDLAGKDLERTRREKEVRLSQVRGETAVRFLDVGFAQERLRQAEEKMTLLEKIAVLAGNLEKQGAVPTLDRDRAAAHLAEARVELGLARIDLDAARKQLAAMWGEMTPSFRTVDYPVDRLPSLPSLPELYPLLAGNAEILYFDAAISRQDAVIDLEKASAVPDIEVAGGYRRFQENGGNGAVVRFSIPLPVSNRNRGQIEAAGEEKRRLQSEKDARLFHLRRTLADHHARLAETAAQLGVFRTEVVAAAEKAVSMTEKGYQYGSLGYLDVLDAQKTVQEARKTLLSLMNRCQVEYVSILLLTGQRPASPRG